MSVPPNKVLTALEHQLIPITSDGAGWSLTPHEADRLAQIGELRRGFCEVGHRQVKLAQFCGVVGLGDRVLEVLPKTQTGNGDAEECRGVLLRLLRLTQRFPHFQHSAVGQHFRRAPLLDAFIAAYFDAVTRVIHGGLLNQYQEYSEVLNLVRGRIALSRQFSKHANRPDLLACDFDELTIDNVWNRVLKKAVRVTRPWIRNLELHRQWMELMGVLSDVDDSGFVGFDQSRLQFDRKAERYKESIDWARSILSLLAPALRAGRQEAPTLLFDMNKLFESAVGTVLRRKDPKGLSLQDDSQTLAASIWAGQSERSFTLKPDFVFRQGVTVTAIADTKWKALEVDQKGRLFPSEADMYQMHAYASAFKCNDLTLVFPWWEGLSSAVETKFQLPEVSSQFPVVSIICIDVHEDSLPIRIGKLGGYPARLLTAT